MKPETAPMPPRGAATYHITDFFTTKQASALLEVSVEKIYSLCREGKLDCVRIKSIKRIYITLRAINDYLATKLNKKPGISEEPIKRDMTKALSKKNKDK